MLHSNNTGVHLSIDETALSNGELYTIVTNKAAKGKKGALVAMVKGTKAEEVTEVLRKIPKQLRDKVREVTLDMAANMNRIVTRCFVKADKVIDQASPTASMFRIGPPTRLAYDAVQEIRIKYRWEALDQENEAIKTAKAAGKPYEPELLENGDTLKQLLARSRYLLFKNRDKCRNGIGLLRSLRERNCCLKDIR